MDTAVLQPHHSVHQADLDFVNLLVNTPVDPSKKQAKTAKNKTAAAGKPQGRTSLRDAGIDSLLLSAVLSGAPLTRHHVGHMATGSYASCDQSRPGTPQRHVHGRRNAAPPTPLASASSSSAEPEAPAVAVPKQRRMSIDPAPVSQLLQTASPAHTNFYHGKGVVPVAPAGRPKVRCMARTRVPTPHGDVFLHIYHNSHDNKEHLAIVTDPIQLSPEARRLAPPGRKEIRSRSLDAVWRQGETDMERVVRGAYVGRLQPGSEGQASKPHDEEEEEEMDDTNDSPPLVRIHSECFTGETIGSMRCDCGEQLDEAMRRIAEPQHLDSSAYLPTPEASRAPSPGTPGPLVPGRGVVIYMRQEGRGIGLLEKIRAYNLQDLGHDTVTANLMLGHGADERTYGVAAEILADLGLTHGVRLLTNNPEKVEGLSGEGVRIAERVSMVPRDWQCGDDGEDYGDWRARRAGVGLLGATVTRGPELDKYLRTKIEKMGHMIDIPEGGGGGDQ